MPYDRSALWERPVAASLHTADGRRVALRVARPDDDELILELHRRLSPRSAYQRYGAPLPYLLTTLLPQLLPAMLQPTAAQITLIGTTAAPAGSAAVALAQLAHDPADRTVAEIGLVIRDDFQGAGLGRALRVALGHLLHARGVRVVRVETNLPNPAVLRLIAGAGRPYRLERRDGAAWAAIDVTG